MPREKRFGVVGILEKKVHLPFSTKILKVLGDYDEM